MLAPLTATKLTASTAYASLLPFTSVEVTFAEAMPAFEDSEAVLTSSASVVVAMSSASHTSTIVRFATIMSRIFAAAEQLASTAIKVAEHH